MWVLVIELILGSVITAKKTKAYSTSCDGIMQMRLIFKLRIITTSMKNLYNRGLFTSSSLDLLLLKFQHYQIIKIIRMSLFSLKTQIRKLLKLI